MTLATRPNPDLAVGPDLRQRWNRPAHRRAGFHAAHTLFRRSATLRAARVLTLEPRPEPRIAALPGLRALEAHPAFSALVVARGQELLHEAHAADFSPDRPHSIQSVTKMHMHLVMGELIAAGLVDPAAPVSAWLPEIGSGYAAAPVAAVLDMDVANDFSEDYDDPRSDIYAYEAAMGWRLPPPGAPEETLLEALARISSAETRNRTGHALYKSANTDVLSLVADRATGGGLWRMLGRIVEAAGYEGAVHLGTDAAGLPVLSGAGCLSARDLARFGLLFARRGAGACGGRVGDAAFLDTARTRAHPRMPPPRGRIGYSRHLFTGPGWIGHGGYGGQFLMVDPEGGAAAAVLSVLDTDSGWDPGYMAGIVDALEAALRACRALSA